MLLSHRLYIIILKHEHDAQKQAFFVFVKLLLVRSHMCMYVFA